MTFTRAIVLIASMAGLVGCAAWPQQDLSLSQSIRPGISPDQVISIMGEQPVATEFSRNYQEWHYCDSDIWDGSDHKFVAVYFLDEEVIGMKPYSVNVKGDGSADCRAYIKKGNYTEPDVIKEYRLNP